MSISLFVILWALSGVLGLMAFNFIWAYYDKVRRGLFQSPNGELKDYPLILLAGPLMLSLTLLVTLVMLCEGGTTYFNDKFMVGPKESE